jgi:hypothetical protein
MELKMEREKEKGKVKTELMTKEMMAMKVK